VKLKYSLPEISVEVLDKIDVLMDSPEATQPPTQASTAKKEVDNAFNSFGVFNFTPPGGWFD
jgi:hypothetical protein